MTYPVWHLGVYLSIFSQINMSIRWLYIASHVPCKCLLPCKHVNMLSVAPVCLPDIHHRSDRWQEVSALQHGVGGLHQAAFQCYTGLQVGDFLEHGSLPVMWFCSVLNEFPEWQMSLWSDLIFLHILSQEQQDKYKRCRHETYTSSRAKYDKSSIDNWKNSPFALQKCKKKKKSKSSVAKSIFSCDNTILKLQRHLLIDFDARSFIIS